LQTHCADKGLALADLGTRALGGVVRIVKGDRDSEVAEKDSAVFVDKEVSSFHIAVDESVYMEITGRNRKRM
jgi:hypothetical protein